MKAKQKTIHEIKRIFSDSLCRELNLTRVEAPLFVMSDSGLQDELDGKQHSVSFPISYDKRAEIVHSLAKWKRLALQRYDFELYEGLLTDMKAIRTGEILDTLHSYYVDQWDWEQMIKKVDRTEDYLKDTVNRIYSALLQTISWMKSKGMEVVELPQKVYFLTTEELLQLYPTYSPKARENAICREYGAVFLMKIGDTLCDGSMHDSRSPDYDDWTLNGDLLVYSTHLSCAIELSSMGIRVDEVSLLEQLKKTGTLQRLEKPYHRMVLTEQLPYTIGGGIGQSRLCMFLLQLHHIGQVQCSYWDEKTYELFEGIL